MPRGDGTGPFGNGSFTGRGRGKCKGFFLTTGKLGTKRVGLYGALVPFIGAVIRDLINPNGLLRSVSRKVIGFRKPIQIKDTVETDYVIIEDKKPVKRDEKKITLDKHDE